MESEQDGKFCLKCGKNIPGPFSPSRLARGYPKYCSHNCANLDPKKTHGMSYEKEYYIWASMKDRCYNPNAGGYRWYGGCGVTVCERWHDFSNFFADMGRKPEGKSIDRIDERLGYSPENCRWATAKEQASHFKNARRYLLRGEMLPIREISEATGIAQNTLIARYKAGWPEHEITSAPSFKRAKFRRG